MIGMQDQRDVDRAALELGRLPVEKAVEQVGGLGELRSRSGRGSTDPAPMELAEDRGQDGRQPLRPADRALAGPRLLGLEQGEGAHRGAQDVHRMRARR